MNLPSHAYVPGLTARHDPAVFASLHSSVRAGMTSKQLADSAAWHAGLGFLEHGYFWEAHEVLEPVWMATLPNSSERHLVQALIQFANAALKRKMGKPRAVRRLCEIALDHLTDCGQREEEIMGMRLDTLRKSIENLGTTKK